MIYTSNSIRVIENYITSSYEEGEKYINEVFNASYNNTSYNVLNEANIITTIKNSIVKFFKWLWSKITEAAGKIKKFLLNIFNKIRGIKVDDKKNSTSSKENKNEENKKVEIIILDFDKAEDTIRELSMDAFFNNTAGIRSLHNSAIATIKDIINSILNRGLAKVTNAITNGGEGDELSDYFSKNAKALCLSCKDKTSTRSSVIFRKPAKEGCIFYKVLKHLFLRSHISQASLLLFYCLAFLAFSARLRLFRHKKQY